VNSSRPAVNRPHFRFATVAISPVHATVATNPDSAYRCGGRGGGAAANALSVKRGPVKLVAMADLFPERLASDLNKLKQSFPSQVDVPPDRSFSASTPIRKRWIV